MKIQKLLGELKARGMRLEPHPTAVIVDHPIGTLTPDIVREVAAHKEELRAWLNTGHLAKQVLAAEFDGATDETVVRLVRILKTARHPLARPALERLLHDT